MQRTTRDSPSYLEVHTYDLNGMDWFDQALKDRVHQRLLENSEQDHATGCQIYTGAWCAKGIGRVRVGSRTYPVARVAAWLYQTGFELWDVRRVYRRRICPNPACFSEEHLFVAATRAEAAQVLRAEALAQGSRVLPRGLTPGRRLTRLKAVEIRQRLHQGEDVDHLAGYFGVTRQSIQRIAANETWRT